MTAAHEIYKDELSKLKAKATGDWGIYVLYQPLPPAYWRGSAAKGGNVLGLERFGEQVLCRKFCPLHFPILYLPNYLSFQSHPNSRRLRRRKTHYINKRCQYTNPTSPGKAPTKTPSSKPQAQISSHASAPTLRASALITRTSTSTMQTKRKTRYPAMDPRT